KNVGSERLVVKNFSKEGVFKNINISVKSKEVVGIYGTVGAGKTECLRGIFGIDKVDTGKINIDGTDVPVGSVKRSLNKGMVLVPEDRKRQGLVLSSS